MARRRCRTWRSATATRSARAWRRIDRWPMQLAARLRADGIAIADPHVVATTGWTTDELDAAIDAAQPLGQFDFVSLLIGVNNQYRGRPLDEYRAQFAALLERAIAFAHGRSDRVLVLSIPDWGVTPFGAHVGRDADAIAGELDAYNAAAQGDLRCARRRLRRHHHALAPARRGGGDAGRRRPASLARDVCLVDGCRVAGGAAVARPMSVSPAFDAATARAHRTRVPARALVRQPLALPLQPHQARQRSAVPGRGGRVARQSRAAARPGLRHRPARARAARRIRGVALPWAWTTMRGKIGQARRAADARGLARCRVRRRRPVARLPAAPGQRRHPRRAAVPRRRRAAASARRGDRDAGAGRTAGDPYRHRGRQPPHAGHACASIASPTCSAG